MIQDKEKEFDLSVKSLMAEAEEEVPSRVWEAIDARLPQRNPAPVWWRWAGVAFAAAAVVLFAFIISGTFKQPSIDILPQSETIVADIPTIPSTAPIEKAETETAAAEPARPLIRKPAATSPVTPAENKTVIIEEENVVPDSTAEEEVAPEIQEKPIFSIERRNEKPSETSIEGKDIDWDTYFDDGNSGKSEGKKMAVDFGGIMGSNDGVSKSSILYGIEALPTTEPSYQTGISEKSTSLYGIPLSFGFGLRFYITDNFSIGTGLNYSLLTRSFTGDYIQADNGQIAKYIKDADVINHIHYIGIPVNAYFDILQSNLIQFYAFGGATFEKGIGSNFRITGDGLTESYRESVKGIQTSAALGIGIQFNVAKSWSLYLDPSARYYFDCDQPKSVRTQKPFMFNFEVGIRYNL